MRQRIGRLFVIKTRTEAWLVTYAVALGAVERGRHYLDTYPGVGGWMLALACTGVVFLVGAKLLDSVTPARVAVPASANMPRIQRRLSRSRPKLHRNRYGSRSPLSLRRD
ncbi:MAG: hypothetical protein ABIW03_01850 [Sphingomicrobium sp.]